MPQLRKDPVSGRWVIIRAESPQLDFKTQRNVKSSRVCPFCPGNESLTPHEIFAMENKSNPKLSRWQVRVVPNKFPALRIEESPEGVFRGMYEKVGGCGAHEVIIENPDHHKEITDLPLDMVELIIRVYRDRCLDLRRDLRMKYLLIFKNYGAAAGASLEHPHSQLIALPVVPSRVMGELLGAEHHFERDGHCLFCQMLEQDRSEKKFTVCEEDGFVAHTPFASRFPFETWILPTAHEASFDELSDLKIKAFAKILQRVLIKLKKALDDPSFNFMIHTIPIRDKNYASFHWHMEIIPQLTQIAGFELGTGFYVNPCPPESAASKLRDF